MFKTKKKKETIAFLTSCDTSGNKVRASGRRFIVAATKGARSVSSGSSNALVIQTVEKKKKKKKKESTSDTFDGIRKRATSLK